MTSTELQDLVFPKYQDFHSHYHVLPNVLKVSYELSMEICELFNTEHPIYCGMRVECDLKLDTEEFELGVLL